MSDDTERPGEEGQGSGSGAGGDGGGFRLTSEKKSEIIWRIFRSTPDLSPSQFAENDERQDLSSYERAKARREWALGEYYAKRKAAEEAKRKEREREEAEAAEVCATVAQTSAPKKDKRLHKPPLRRRTREGARARSR
jgi:hypothetical protein